MRHRTPCWSSPAVCSLFNLAEPTRTRDRYLSRRFLINRFLRLIFSWRMSIQSCRLTARSSRAVSSRWSRTSPRSSATASLPGWILFTLTSRVFAPGRSPGRYGCLLTGMSTASRTLSQREQSSLSRFSSLRRASACNFLQAFLSFT